MARAQRGSRALIAGVYIYVFDHPEGKATVKCVSVYVCICIYYRVNLAGEEGGRLNLRVYLNFFEGVEDPP